MLASNLPTFHKCRNPYCENKSITLIRPKRIPLCQKCKLIKVDFYKILSLKIKDGEVIIPKDKTRKDFVSEETERYLYNHSKKEVHTK